jgi:hypothetical protein
MENTTRISDLPENMHLHPSLSAQQPHNNEFPTNGNNYIPLNNIHPNPYGNATPNIGNIGNMDNGGGGMKPPQYGLPTQPHTHNNNNNNIEYGQSTQQRLPSRDIPMQQTNYTQDNEITANYVPKPKQSNDYLNEYEEEIQENKQKSKKHKKKVHFIEDEIFVKLQTPIFVTILYFVFQTNIFQKCLKTYLSFVPLFKEDGNLSFYGIAFKSVLFGSAVFGFRRFFDMELFN